MYKYALKAFSIEEQQRSSKMPCNKYLFFVFNSTLSYRLVV